MRRKERLERDGGSFLNLVLVLTLITISVMSSRGNTEIADAPPCGCRSLYEIGNSEEAQLCTDKGYKGHDWISGFINQPETEMFVCISKEDWRIQTDPPSCNTKDPNSCIPIRDAEHAKHKARTIDQIVHAEQQKQCGEDSYTWTTIFNGPIADNEVFRCVDKGGVEYGVPWPLCNEKWLEECWIIQQAKHTTPLGE